LSAAVLAAGVVLLVPGTAGAAAGGRTAVSPNGHAWYRFGGVAAGQSATQVFTISTGRWGQWSGTLAVQLSRTSDFSVASDGCTGTQLTPATPSCQVSVTFAPTSTGPTRKFAVLSVFGSSTAAGGWFRPHARFISTILLSGHVTTSGGTVGGTGPASLQLSPATATGTNGFSYSFGQTGLLVQNFTLRNVGGSASLPLALNGWSSGGYSLSADTCTGLVLVPNGTCTFTETWTSADDPLCDGVGEAVSLSSTVDSSDASTNYADVSLSAVCG
jgi:hypothetical protein